jgi:hypothetical protein
MNVQVFPANSVVRYELEAMALPHPNVLNADLVIFPVFSSTWMSRRIYVLSDIVNSIDFMKTYDVTALYQTLASSMEKKDRASEHTAGAPTRPDPTSADLRSREPTIKHVSNSFVVHTSIS